MAQFYFEYNEPIAAPTTSPAAAPATINKTSLVKANKTAPAPAPNATPRPVAIDKSFFTIINHFNKANKIPRHTFSLLSR